jgi:radical SAM superfamily enzyme
VHTVEVQLWVNGEEVGMRISSEPDCSKDEVILLLEEAISCLKERKVLLEVHRDGRN